MAKFLLSLVIPFVLRGVSVREFNSGMEAGTWEWHRKAAPPSHLDLLALARSGCKKSQKKIFWRFWSRCVSEARKLFEIPGERLRDRKTDMVFQKPEEANYFVWRSEIPGLYISMLCQGWRFKTGGDVPRQFVRFWWELDLGRSIYSGIYIDNIGERACILFHRGFTGRQAWYLLIGHKNVLRDSSCVTVGASAKALRGARMLMRVAHKFGLPRVGLPRVGFEHFRIRNRDAERIASMSAWGALAVVADILASSDEAYANEKEAGTQVECIHAPYDCYTIPKDLTFEDIHGESSPFVGTSGKFRSTLPIRWEKVAESLKGRGWKTKLLERVAQWSGDMLFRPTHRQIQEKNYYRILPADLFVPKPLWFEVTHRENPSLVWEELRWLLEEGEHGLSLEELRLPILAKWRKLCVESPRGEAGSDREWSVYMWKLLAAFGGNVRDTQEFLRVVGELFVTGERETPWHFAANNFGVDTLKMRAFLKWGKVWLATRTMPLLSDILLVSNKWEASYADGKFEDARRHAAAKLYTGIPENISAVCGRLDMSQNNAAYYRDWLGNNPVKTSEAIPAPKAEPVGGFRVRQLAHDDMRGPLLGVETHCCQHPRGAAAETARQGWISPNGAFWVVEDTKTGKLVAMTHVWRNGGDMVLDSLEYSSANQKAVESGIVGMALREAARSCVGRLGIGAVWGGAGHTSMSATIGVHSDDRGEEIGSPAGERLYRSDSCEVYRVA